MPRKDLQFFTLRQKLEKSVTELDERHARRSTRLDQSAGFFSQLTTAQGDVGSKVSPMMKYGANISVIGLVTTFAVACVKVPVDKILLNMAKESVSFVGALRAGALYTGYTTAIKGGLPRSMWTIHSKEASAGAATESTVRVIDKEVLLESKLSAVEVKAASTGAIVNKSGNVNEASESVLNKQAAEQSITEQESNNQNSQNMASRVSSIMIFSGVETLLTHGADQKTALAQMKLEYTPNFSNYATLMRSGIGVRFTSAAVSLTCMTSIQEFYANLFPQSMRENHRVATAMTSGVLSGSTAACLTYPLKQLQTAINASAQVDNTQLRYKHTTQLIRDNVSSLFKQSLAQTVREISPKLLLRACQTSVTFAIIITVSTVLGRTPAEDLYKSLSNKSSPDESESRSDFRP